MPSRCQSCRRVRGELNVAALREVNPTRRAEILTPRRQKMTKIWLKFPEYSNQMPRNEL
jgi:hypothetical protein